MKTVVLIAMVAMFLIATNAFALELVFNETCPVMGNPVDGKHFGVYMGKAYGLCCPGCIEAFEADPEKYIATIPSEDLGKSFYSCDFLCAINSCEKK